MIYDTLAHRSQYYGLGERFKMALDFLAETDFSKLEDGKRYDLDGDNVFIKMSTYQTKERNDRPEGHKEYIDIQFLAEGRESVGVADMSQMTQTEAYPEKDNWRFNGPMDYITLEGTKFMIFWPGDAHAPCIAIGEQSTVRKCLVKIKVN